MMPVLLEGVLDEELYEELGYSKYDYKNKDTSNGKNGYSQKTMHTSYGDMKIAVHHERNSEYEPHLIKKISEYCDLEHGRKDTLHICKRYDH